MAMRSTSSGISTIRSPLRLNMTKIVNSRAISVSGLMRGMNFCSYQSRPLVLSPMKRVSMPAMNGMPR